MGAHHQRLAHASPPVYEPAVMNPSITAGSGTGSDGPAITIDLNPTVPKTVGDAFLEPAVIGVAVVASDCFKSEMLKGEGNRPLETVLEKMLTNY